MDPYEEVVVKEEGHKMFLLGNEAIVRGAVEAGIDTATTYPGTPSSEIGKTFEKTAKRAGIYFEYSANEKISMEIAGAAATAGQRVLNFMKHVGVNVAADALMTLAYTGVRGSLVIITADDPSCHSSQNEQDNRYYARLAGIPMLEPANPQEMKDFIVSATRLSEKYESPIFLRTTTRVNHARGIVEFGGKTEQHGRISGFERDPKRLCMVPGNAKAAHPRLLEKLQNIKKGEGSGELNPIEVVGDEGNIQIGIITSGVAYNYAYEAAQKLGVNAKILKLGLTFPLDEEYIMDFVNSVPKVFVVEEVETILEKEVRTMAQLNKSSVEIYGKEGVEYLPRFWELNPDLVTIGLSKIMGVDFVYEPLSSEIELPPRPPTLCPGCPHRATFWAANKVTKGNVIYGSDIGCYTLGLLPPLNTADSFLCMGGSVSVAQGYSISTDQKVMTFIGDSTFFHSGIHGILNAVHNRHKFVYVIMDNRTTAMTGHQPHPGTPRDGMGNEAPALDIEAVVKGCQAEFVRTVDPMNLENMVKVFEEAWEHDGIAVVIAKHPCALIKARDRRKAGEVLPPWEVVHDKCKACKKCIRTFACPALYVLEDGKTAINPNLCDSCGVCAQVCPFDAIHPTGGDE